MNHDIKLIELILKYGNLKKLNDSHKYFIIENSN